MSELFYNNDVNDVCEPISGKVEADGIKYDRANEKCCVEKHKITNSMTSREKKELHDKIKAMTTEELIIVADAIPVELCLERIQRELEKAEEMKNSIERAYEMAKQ